MAEEVLLEETSQEKCKPVAYRKVDREQRQVYLVVVSAAIIAIVAAFVLIFLDYNLKMAEIQQQNHTCVCPPGPSGPACPDGWIGYQGKCYSTSDVKKDWPSSLKDCNSQMASLLTLSHDKEEEFVQRHLYKGTTWLGLSKDSNQQWRWTNEENSGVPKVNGEGECAYLNKDGNAIGARCSTELHRICSKPDAFNRQSEETQ